MIYIFSTGWYDFDVTSAVERWIKLKKPHVSKKFSNQLMIEKGTVNVKRSISNTTDYFPDERKFSFVPIGVFEMANLIVYSKDSQTVRTRKKRRADDKKRKKGNKRRNKKNKTKRIEERCRLHELEIDYGEV